ncbi:hypothetical protein ACIO02_23165 [Streptomyces sp. NPDC087568]|uniref:hypothetical protein n=1 Tax=Streptomyces sp. NPDC087568 TaxID=3365799 RepID=UPI0038237CF7
MIDPYIFVHLNADVRLSREVLPSPQVNTEGKNLVPPSAIAFAVLALALLASVLLALLAAVAAGLLAHLDGASLPAAVQRAGVTFGGTLTLAAGLLAMGAGVLK